MKTGNRAWVTNDPDTARLLRKIDRQYAKAIKTAQLLHPYDLTAKVAAINLARAVRHEGYHAVIVATAP